MATVITRRDLVRRGGAVVVLLLLAAGADAGEGYDLLLRGGHVIDPGSGTSAVRDVAIADGKIAAVAPRIDPERAFKVVDVSGLYVTPGLVDLHAHVYANTGERGSYAGDNAVAPDGFTFRAGVTTVVDAGGAGYRNFDDFKDRIIDRSRTRVLAFLNIVGHGMRGGAWEQDVADMEAKPAAQMVRAHRGLIVGIKTAHYEGPDWLPVERAVEAGTLAEVPVITPTATRACVTSSTRTADSTPRWRPEGDVACGSTWGTARGASPGTWRPPPSPRAFSPTPSRPTCTWTA